MANLKVDVETRNIEDLHKDPANARSHDERNLATIKDSLTEFGQVEPLIVDTDGKVIGGNGRLEAMRSLEWTEAQVVELDVDEVTATKLALALNRTAELATWDEDALGQHLEALLEEDEDLDTFWNDEELNDLLATLEPEPDTLQDPAPVTGIELDPAYVDVTLHRYHELTGTRAETQDGKEFNPVKVKQEVAP